MNSCSHSSGISSTTPARLSGRRPEERHAQCDSTPDQNPNPYPNQRCLDDSFLKDQTQRPFQLQIPNTPKHLLKVLPSILWMTLLHPIKCPGISPSSLSTSYGHPHAAKTLPSRCSNHAPHLLCLCQYSAWRLSESALKFAVAISAATFLVGW